MFQQPGTSILQQVEHIFKSFRPTIIRIGNVVGMRKTGTEFRHTVYLLPFFRGGRTVFQIFNIPVIHPYYQIEVIKVFRLYGTRTMCEFVTSTNSVSTHPAVRQLSSMIRENTGRVYHKLIFQSGFWNQMIHHTFRRGRTANITQANKKYSMRLHKHISFNSGTQI